MPTSPDFRVLSESFFDRDPRKVARDLLGKLLVRRRRRHLLAGRIVEVEAYLGANDLAAHSAAGRTARNQVLFGPPGRAYVYFIYGMHYCLNVSCLPPGNPGCVLFRALEPVAGIELMARNRGLDLQEEPSVRLLRSIAGGPSRLCEALDITRARDDGKNLTSAASDLFLADDGHSRGRVQLTPRIGITKDAHHLLRFIVEGSPFASRNL